MASNLSYWEKISLLRYDFVIVGSGLVGLSTAISLRERAPNQTVLVLERGLLPSGASTKNAGFACFGNPSEILRDINELGESEAVALVERRYQGLNLLRKRFTDEEIGYQNSGGYELLFKSDAHLQEKLPYLNSLLQPIFGRDIFSLSTKKLAEFGFNRSEIAALVANDSMAGLHTGKLVNALLNRANQLGVRIITGAEVRSVSEGGDDGVGVEVSSSHSSQSSLTFTADRVAICTNAFSKQLLPEIVLQPGRGQILITEPIPNLPFRGCFDFKEGYYYFRELDGRVLIGGGRELDMNSESTTSFGTTKRIQDKLVYYLREVIIPGIKFSVEDRWSGIMAFGESPVPVVNRCSKNVFAGVRCGGMGVALATELGQELSALVLEL